jgi:hypothetical protein
MADSLGLLRSIAILVGIALSVIVLAGVVIVRLAGGALTIHQRMIAVALLAVSGGLLLSAFVSMGRM